LTITFVRRGAAVGAWSAETATAQPNLRRGLRRRFARSAARVAGEPFSRARAASFSSVSVARAPRRHREHWASSNSLPPGRADGVSSGCVVKLWTR